MNQINKIPSLLDRSICAATYLTGGTVGFVWLIYCSVQEKTISKFIRYHAIQSILLGVLVILVNEVIQYFYNFIHFLPFIGGILANIFGLFTTYPLLGGCSIYQLALLTFMMYMTLTSFQGQFTRIPWITEKIVEKAI